MQKLWAAFGSCAKFTYTNQGTTLNSVLKRFALTGIGDQAVEAVTKSGTPGGISLVAVRVSNSIITIADSSPSADDGLGSGPRVREAVYEKAAVCGRWLRLGPRERAG